MAKRSLKMASLKMATPPENGEAQPENGKPENGNTAWIAAPMLDRCSHAQGMANVAKWQRSLKTAMRPETEHLAFAVRRR